MRCDDLHLHDVAVEDVALGLRHRLQEGRLAEARLRLVRDRRPVRRDLDRRGAGLEQFAQALLCRAA